MNRWISAMTCAVFLLCAVSTFAAPDPEADLRAATSSYREALVKKDYPALEKIWTDDYTFIDGHGHLRTKAERLADLRSSVTTLDSIKHEAPAKIRIHGDVGIVTSNVTLTGRYNGKTVSGPFRSTHLWIHADGRWQLMMNQLTAIQ
ncbi:MAG: nuclear transport factor 2 family protein [Acidobacteriota bacterium]